MQIKTSKGKNAVIVPISGYVVVHHMLRATGNVTTRNGTKVYPNVSDCQEAVQSAVQRMRQKLYWSVTRNNGWYNFPESPSDKVVVAGFRAGDSPVPEMHWWTFEAVIVEE